MTYSATDFLFVLRKIIVIDITVTIFSPIIIESKILFYFISIYNYNLYFILM